MYFQHNILLHETAHIIDEFIPKSFLTIQRSFTYKRKRRGPNMLPCGTPDVTGTHEENVRSVTTR